MAIQFIRRARRACLAVAALVPTLLLTGAPVPTISPGAVSLFDGKTLAGWEGEPRLWRVEEGTLTGGSLSETLAHNYFLASQADYTNFIVRFEIRLGGSVGFLNSGFQIRSQRVPGSTEMAGYQCDYGEPNWYGAIYDESRRNQVLAPSDMEALRPVLKVGDWNEYVIRADGPRITTWINGAMGTDYFETDPSIPLWGKFGIQIHAEGRPLVQVRNLRLQELPPSQPGRMFRGAPAPATGVPAVAVPPAEELARFTLAPGFVMELVAAEELEAGIGKFVAVDWDAHGNLWTMTALEYPVDANENPAVAAELYASRARDKVLVYDRDPASPTGYARRARVFADGLAIPLGILPYANGVYVQHGTEIVFLSDTDGDGKADKRTPILSGFGVQDSHLFPHQFTRAPGNWIWFAQGAFNYGKVRTSRGKEVQFDQTRMARFRYDGSEFDITSQGPCNIWGLFMTMEGETWIQEANDFGYPTMPFHEYANYPGCSQAQWKSYAPEFPGTAPHFQMGGTGLSGLAIADTGTWPEPYGGVIYIANPITRKIQAIRAERDGPRYSLLKLPDFVQSSDEMFRPVALRLGPDGCLYIVDWYNKIISHNEVPRNHPERDKKHGRIWRLRHTGQTPDAVPDFTRVPGEELLSRLGGRNTTQSHLAWQAIGDRKLTNLAPALRHLVAGQTEPAARRIAALWSLEALGAVDPGVVAPLLKEGDRGLRREGVRGLASEPPRGPAAAAWDRWFSLLEGLADDPDPEVRAEVIRTVGNLLPRLADTSEPSWAEIRRTHALPLLARMARAPMEAPVMRSTQSGRLIKSGAAYEREFERYLVRLFLESEPSGVAGFLESAGAGDIPVENRLLLALALSPEASAPRVAELLPLLSRGPGQEEVLRLAQFPSLPGVGEALRRVLQKPATRGAALEALLAVRTRLDPARITPLLGEAARQLLAGSDPQGVELGARLAGAFQLAVAEPLLAPVLEGSISSAPAGTLRLSPAGAAALRALRDLKTDRIDLLAAVASRGEPGTRDAAVQGLAGSRDAKGPERLVTLYADLPAAQRRTAINALGSSPAGAAAIVAGVRGGQVAREDLDASVLAKLHTLLGADHAGLSALMQEIGGFFRPALRLNGQDNAWADTDITLEGAFTVETWVMLDAGIDNNDGILGAPNQVDMNFFGSQFRVWVGGGVHDVVVSKKRMAPDIWTHLAVTRDAAGRFRLFRNGEPDTEGSTPVPRRLEHLRVGWTQVGAGTAGWLTEFRIWNRERTGAEIRSDFDRSFEGEPLPPGLVRYYPGAGPWGRLQPGASVLKTATVPPLVTGAEARALAAKFDRYRTLAAQPGDAARGQATFKAVCMGCHSVAGQGGQVGPVLNGAGASGIEALLRNVITPNAAMEAGYRLFRVQLKDGDLVDGIRLSEDSEAVVVRRPNVEDLRIPQSAIRRASFTQMSMMPEGLLDSLPPKEVSDLLAYLLTLR